MQVSFKILRYLGAAIALIFAAQSASAQNSKRRHKPLMYFDSDPMADGLTIAPLGTYTFAAKRTENRTLLENPDSTWVGDFARKGKLGAGVAVGWHKWLQNPRWLDYIDFGVHWKWFRGAQETTVSILQTENQNVLSTVVQESSFSDHYAGLYFNATNVWQISDYKFITNSLGVNADYRVITNHELGALSAITGNTMQPNLTAQLHYKIGFGFKLQKNLFFVPSIETPILSVQPWEDGKSSLQYFSSRYRPIIVSAQFMWLRDRPLRKCVGSDTDPKNKKRRNRSRTGDKDLFGPGKQGKKLKHKGKI